MPQNTARGDFHVRMGKAKKGQTGNREKRAGVSFLRQMQKLGGSGPLSGGVARDRAGRLSGGAARGRAAGRGAFVKAPLKAAQRVVVKARVVKNAPGAQNKTLLKAHVNYIARDGVGEGEDQNPQLYNEKGLIEKEELEAWLEEAAKDRHHFRFIISPENARNLDLTAYTKEVVARIEKDLVTKLEYVAANHFNTDNPHAHVIIRGVDQNGKDLVISKDYVSNGVRNRATEIATNHLGHRTELEIRAGITAETTKERWTQIDRDLLKAQGAHPESIIDTRFTQIHERSFADFKRQVQIQRLKELEKMNLAHEVKPGVWALDGKAEATLKELGEKGDIIKTMHKSLRKDAIQEYVVYDTTGDSQLNITGVVIKKALINELYDEKYMIVAATDNRAYYVPLSRYSEAPEFVSKLGSIVTISVKKAEGKVRAADENIVQEAALNKKIYSVEEHLKSIKKEKKWLTEGVTAEEYVDNHVKRLGALEARGIVTKISDTEWQIPDNMKEHILATAEGKGKNNFVQVKLESMQNLQEQVEAHAPTWIDKELSTGKYTTAEGLKSGFVRDLRKARIERLDKLCELDAAIKTPDGNQIKRDYKDELYKIQIQEANARNGRYLGTPKELKPGESFVGEVKRFEALPSGPHAIITQGTTFVTVPYQKGMDRLKGQQITLQVSKNPKPSITFSAVDPQKKRGIEVI